MQHEVWDSVVLTLGLAHSLKNKTKQKPTTFLTVKLVP